VLQRLGSIPLRGLTPDVVNRFRLELEADGVGPASIRQALVLLQGVLQRACEWGRLASNPVAIVRKPVPPRARTIVPLAPERVEAIRFALLRCGRIRDATLVSVLAYAGLRPGEALALRWTHVRERTLLVEGAVSLGAIEGTKTGRSRTVRVLGPLAQDLAEWWLHAGRPPAEALLFPGHDSEPWSAASLSWWYVLAAEDKSRGRCQPRSSAKVRMRASEDFATTARLRCWPVCSAAPSSWSRRATHEGQRPSASARSAVCPSSVPAVVTGVTREDEAVDGERVLARRERLRKPHVGRPAVRSRRWKT
jgi:Phage integrase family